MQSQQNQIVTYRAADSESFSLALSGLTAQLFRAAEENINMATSGDDGWSDVEKRAMIAAEALRLTSGMDLAAIITRGQIIQQIEREGLISVHPNGYADLTALAKEQGISVSELSDTRALYEVIFPYITNTLGRDLAQVWTEVGKSSMRELVPALRSLISGDNAAHTTVREAVEQMLNNAAAELVAGGTPQSELLEEDVRRQAVETLLVQGATLPTRELRRTVRPSRTQPVEAATLITGESQWRMLIEITSQEQYDMLMRLLGTHANNMLVDGRNEVGQQLNTISRRVFGR